MALLVLPLIVIVLNGLRVRNCNWPAGFSFFLLLPLCSAGFAATSGALCAFLLESRAQPFSRIIALSIPAVSIAASLIRLYVDPPIFAFDPFGGFFPGPIYDAAVVPEWRMVVYRLLNGLWMLAAISVGSALRKPGIARFGTATALCIAGLAAFAVRGALEIHLTHEDLTERLARKNTTEHFVVHSDPADGQTPQELALFLSDLEFRYAQLKDVLGTEPAGPVRVYRFATADQKKRLVGAAHTLFTKPWRREIFIQVDEFPGRRLRHELAHIFAAEFGDPLLGISLRFSPFPRLASGLIEGLAEASDYGDPKGDSTLHQSARALIDSGRAPPLHRVVGSGFSTLAGPSAYTIAASFCHYLLITHGAASLRRLYETAGDFQGIYDQTLDHLEQNWRAFLAQTPLTEKQLNQADEQFRQPAIFARPCARDVAVRVRQSDGLRSHRPGESVAIMRTLCVEDPGEPNHKLRLSYALAASSQDDEAIRHAEKLANDDRLTFPTRRRAAQFAAAIHFHSGHFEQAEQALQDAAALTTTEASERTVRVQQLSLKSEAARSTLGRVMFGRSATQRLDSVLALHLTQQFAEAFPNAALGPYLIGLRLAGRDDPLAAHYLFQACGPETTGDPSDSELRSRSPKTEPLPPIFERACLRALAKTAYAAAHLHLAEEAAQASLLEARNEAEKLRALDFLERVEWTRAAGSRETRAQEPQN